MEAGVVLSHSIFYGILAGWLILQPAQNQIKTPPIWKLDTGLEKVRRTTATWDKYGSLGRLKTLPIDIRDRSGLQDEIEIKNTLASHRNDGTGLAPYAAKYRKSKSPRDLQRLLLAITSISEGGKEMAATYRGGSGDGDFGLAEYIEFRKTIGSELNILETKILIVCDNSYFANAADTYSLYKKLDKGGFGDRKTAFSVISAVMESYLVTHKNANLVPELYKLAEKLYTDRKSQRSINTFSGTLLAMGILKHDKALYERGLSLPDGVRLEMSRGDEYDRMNLRLGQETRDFWIKKGKELFPK